MTVKVASVTPLGTVHESVVPTGQLTVTVVVPEETQPVSAYAALGATTRAAPRDASPSPMDASASARTAPMRLGRMTMATPRFLFNSADAPTSFDGVSRSWS